ncbi:hypothetical protein AVEN_104068-1 [Araneus ventricosus]|uniref:Uncharacterized protein n=1 Tax=Araneus ventricosus TaxID=182803 RepID=A0A4Y2SRS8_ARAVE|nr:hypothetical protein AVEN_104068-1 [Araneus ventricosus]
MSVVVGWSGLGKKSRCQDKNAVSSRHNSKNNPPCLRSWCYLNLSSSTRKLYEIWRRYVNSADLGARLQNPFLNSPRVAWEQHVNLKKLDSTCNCSFR